MSTVEEAFLIATYVISRLPTCVLQGISPVEHMLSFSPLPLLSSLSCYVFGCIAFVHSHSPHRGKLDPRVVKCVFKLKGGGTSAIILRVVEFFVSMDVTFH